MNIMKYHWISLNITEYRWNINEYQPISLNIIEYHEISLNIIKYHWISLEYQGISWNITEYHIGISLNILNKYHWISLEYHWISLIIIEYCKSIEKCDNAMLWRASGSSFFAVFSHASKSFSNPASCSACRSKEPMALWIYEWTANYPLVN